MRIASKSKKPLTENQKVEKSKKISQTLKAKQFKLSDERKLENSLYSRGENNPAAKLTTEQVKEIRSLRASGWTRRQLTEKFHVSLGTIDGIIYFLTWKHV